MNKKSVFMTILKIFLLAVMIGVGSSSVFAQGLDSVEKSQENNDGSLEWANTATLFKLSGESTLNNAKITWDAFADADRYDIYRNDEKIATSTGDTYDDYDLLLGEAYSYFIKAYNGEAFLAQSVGQVVTPVSIEGTADWDNKKGGNSFGFPEGIEYKGNYYSYPIEGKRDEQGNLIGVGIYETISEDGYTNWSEKRELVFYEGSQLRFEGVGVFFNQKTQKFVVAAHFEDEGGYTAAKVYLASITPGGELEEGFIDRPLGNDSRDMSLFVDDDNTAYLLSSTRMNSDINIYRLDETWTEPVQLVNTVFEGQHRETPSIIKEEGYYYFFSSKASGWYPSQAMYASASSMDGQWSELRQIGNAATFGAQSNGLAVFGVDNQNHGMYAYRWGGQYIDREETGSYPRLLPATFNNGFATVEYYSNLEYNDSYGLIPVQSGRNLSLGKEVTASSAAPDMKDPNVITDGHDLTWAPGFKGEQYPYEVVIDVEKEAYIDEMNLTTKLVGGSETAYKYTIEGSKNGENYEMILDNRENWRVGFQIDEVSPNSSYRYVRLTVYEVINVHNRNSATWADEIKEFAIFGRYAVNKDELEKLYKEEIAKAREENNYPTELWQEYQGLLTEIQEVLENETISQEEVDQLTVKLSEMIEKIDESQETIEATDITLSANAIETLKVKKTLIVTANVTPENATNQEVTWEIEDDSIVTISDNGVFKGMKPGITKVTAKINNITKSFTIRVTR